MAKDKVYTLKQLAEKHLKTPFRDQTYMLEGMKQMFSLKDDEKLTEEKFLDLFNQFKNNKLED